MFWDKGMFEQTRAHVCMEGFMEGSWVTAAQRAQSSALPCLKATFVCCSVPQPESSFQLYPSYCYKACSCFYSKLNLFPFVAQVFPSSKQLFQLCLLVFTPTDPQVFIENNPIPSQPSAKHIRCCLCLSGSPQH